MDVRRLDLLRELAARGSVTAVAAATHRTPSAVSQQLKVLEDLKRAAWGVNNPSHITSQAQGIAALLAKTAPQKND